MIYSSIRISVPGRDLFKQLQQVRVSHPYTTMRQGRAHGFRIRGAMNIDIPPLGIDLSPSVKAGLTATKQRIRVNIQSRSG